MKKLVLLGGPPGVGKTATLWQLGNKLTHSALLDADDVWRVSNEHSLEENRSIAIQNVIHVMQGYFEAGCHVGIVSWVFARPQLFEPVIEGLKSRVDSIQQIYLTATEEAIEKRLAHRMDQDRLEYSRTRLELINALPFTRIDTTNLSPNKVADQVKDIITNDVSH